MNILVYTSIYPIEGTKVGFTPVVKYFCEEWIKLGHDVVVVSSTSKFPSFYYVIPETIVKYFESKKGFNFPNSFGREKKLTIENGVKVYQLPIEKIIPGQLPKRTKIEDKFKEVVKYLKFIRFVPDVAVGHWVNPQVIYLSLTKKHFDCRTALTLQNIISDIEIKLLNSYIFDLDYIGYRSEPIKKSAINKINFSKQKNYMCFSGVTDYFNIAAKPYSPKLRKNKTLRICFVGNLIHRKFPEKIIEALNSIKDTTVVFKVSFIGEGVLKSKISKMKKRPNIIVNALGRIPREKVYQVLKQKDVFIMISKNETFGLVYLEAMLNRVIPIASYNEGFDGVIKDGVNGFLCEAGNQKQLSQIISHILTIKSQEYLEVQKKAFETAVNMTDDKMAIAYLNNII